MGFAVMIVALHAASAEAQAISGRLADGSPGAPVVGALVALHDSAGNRVVQGVSGSTGRFLLRAPHVGIFTLRVLRIGFAPWGTEVQLADGETVERALVLTSRRVTLPDVKVEGQLLCGARAAGDSLSAVLWDQARTALSLADEAVRSRRYRYYTVLQERTVDGTGKRSAELAARDVSHVVTQWPVRSPPPDSLLVHGFILDLEDLVSGPIWYGPDAQYLLSEPFFADHCFQLVPPGADQHPDWVGLGFSPALRSPRPDIRGVLWLDRAKVELRRLDFGYTRLPSWAYGRQAFGQLEFAPLPGGGWIVQRWVLRVPIPEVDISRRTVRFLEYRESGGYVSQVMTSSGEEIARYSE